MVKHLIFLQKFAVLGHHCTSVAMLILIVPQSQFNHFFFSRHSISMLTFSNLPNGGARHFSRGSLFDPMTPKPGGGKGKVFL